MSTSKAAAMLKHPAAWSIAQEAIDMLHSTRTHRYYVYVLSTEDGPFYVGKGSGNRVFDHRVAARQKSCSCARCLYIRAAWAAGKTLREAIVYRTNEERKAYRRERQVIARFRRRDVPLLNQTAGGGPRVPRDEWKRVFPVIATWKRIGDYRVEYHMLLPTTPHRMKVIGRGPKPYLARRYAHRAAIFRGLYRYLPEYRLTVVVDAGTRPAPSDDELPTLAEMRFDRRYRAEEIRYVFGRRRRRPQR